MSESNVISFEAVRKLKNAEAADPVYARQIGDMDKLELLNEMVTFQEERSRAGKLTADMIIRGRILFKALEDKAETQALKILTQSYRRHLEYEMKSYIQNGTLNQ